MKFLSRQLLSFVLVFCFFGSVVEKSAHAGEMNLNSPEAYRALQMIRRGYDRYVERAGEEKAQAALYSVYKIAIKNRNQIADWSEDKFQKKTKGLAQSIEQEAEASSLEQITSVKKQDYLAGIDSSLEKIGVQKDANGKMKGESWENFKDNVVMVLEAILALLVCAIVIGALVGTVFLFIAFSPLLLAGVLVGYVVGFAGFIWAASAANCCSF